MSCDRIHAQSRTCAQYTAAYMLSFMHASACSATYVVQALHTRSANSPDPRYIERVGSFLFIIDG